MTRLVENLNPCNQEAQEIRIELNSVKENSKPKKHKKQGNKNKKKVAGVEENPENTKQVQN